MLNLSKIKAITLDLDDTLWPVMPTIARAELALEAWLSEHAPETARLCTQPGVKQAIRSEVHQRHPDMAHDLSFLRREAIRASLLRAGDAPHLAEPAFEVFFAERQNVVLYDGVLDALAKLAVRYPLVSVSNGNADVFRTSAAPYFTAAISARSLGVAKPDAQIFHAAAAQLQLPAEALLHVGDDSSTDVLGARQAGLQTVWVNTQGQSWSHASPQPLTVHHLVELCDHLLT